MLFRHKKARKELLSILFDYGSPNFGWYSGHILEDVPAKDADVLSAVRRHLEQLYGPIAGELQIFHICYQIG